MYIFSNYTLNEENEIGKMFRPNMCKGFSFSDMVSIIPEHLRPSNEAFMQMISESSQKEKPVEIVLDTDADVSLCCQAFVDFLENFLFPWIADTSEGEFNEEPVKEFLAKTSDHIRDILASNCKEWIYPNNDTYWSSLTTEGKIVRENRAKENRYIGDSVWWRLEFEKCLAGEEFDFSKHTTDWPG